VREGGEAAWGAVEGEGRATMYAGAAVGLVREVMGAGEIVEEVRDGVVELLKGLSSRW